MVFQVLEALCANPWGAHSFRAVILEDHVLQDVCGATIASEVTLYEDFCWLIPSEPLRGPDGNRIVPRAS